ncbi:MAG: ABC transporter ATP-binding protein [Phycisphaeraceae bacterium]|nr:ABC transporter ATP-binding protein [Phycisphaeraceae bacterium]
MIEALRVSKWYGHVPALRDVSFNVPQGQIVGLLGPNGAGKTTTIRIATGFLPPSAGSVSVCGHDTVDDSLAARRCIGYLPDSAPLYSEMSVQGYLDYRGRLYGLQRRARRDAAARVVDRCRLGEVRARRIGQLSKGFRQRVGLASALLHDPPVLILDEPMTGLDPSQIREARSLVRELAENRTVLISSHILPEVEQTCHRVIIIANGMVRADGAPSELVSGLSGSAPYVAEVLLGPTGDTATVVSVLSAVAGVASVRAEPMAPDNGQTQWWARLTLTPSPGTPDLREAIARAAASRSLTLRELRRDRATLEHLFMRVIEDGSAGLPAAPVREQVTP